VFGQGFARCIFEFTGLIGGSLFSLTATVPNPGFFSTIPVFASANNAILGPNNFGQRFPVSFPPTLVPLDGILVVGVSGNEGSGLMRRHPRRPSLPQGLAWG